MVVFTSNGDCFKVVVEILKIFKTKVLFLIDFDGLHSFYYLGYMLTCLQPILFQLTYVI